MTICIHGIERVALRNEKTSDGTNLQFGSLYLQGVKIASFQQEKRGSIGAYSVQLFMMNGYSEETFLQQLAGYDLTVETLLEQLQWLHDMRTQYTGHSDTAAGIACMHHISENITMGIPLRLSDAPEEIVLRELQHFIEKNEETYGECLGYAIFRKDEDFARGEVMSLDLLKK